MTKSAQDHDGQQNVAAAMALSLSMLVHSLTGKEKSLHIM
jgi:hypothetical protein